MLCPVNLQLFQNKILKKKSTQPTAHLFFYVPKYIPPLNIQSWSRHPGKKPTLVSPLPRPVRQHFLAHQPWKNLRSRLPPLPSQCHIHPCQSEPLPNPIPTLLWATFLQHKIPHPRSLFSTCWESPHVYSQAYKNICKQPQTLPLYEDYPGFPKSSNCHIFSNFPVLSTELYLSTCHLSL